MALETASPAAQQRRDGFLPIQSYALIGDCRTAALVGSDGSIDWLCWPRPDSDPLFGRLLDPGGGHFSIEPAGTFRSERSYRDGSNVLETTFETDDGACRVTDLLAAVPIEMRRRMLLPETMVVRVVEGLAGTTVIDVDMQPRAGFSERKLNFRRTNDRSVVSTFRRDHLLHLAADVPLEISESGVHGRAQVGAGDRLTFALALTADEPAVFPPVHAVDAVIDATDAYWRNWASKCTGNIPGRELVVRSALTLKLLSFAPSGAIIAAPTTSLPEVPGGDRNWDYRFCWLRDASLTVRAFMSLGYEDEARAFTQWMLHATRLSRPKLQVLYDVYGRKPGPERELEHVVGFQRARPVRVGNEASEQTQLDVYGEVVDAVAECYGSDSHLSRDERLFVEDIVKFVADHWTDPDHGIWEKRGEPKHYVDSKVMSWVALDRAAQLADKGLIRMDPGGLRATADAVQRAVRTRGFSERLDSFRQTFDEDALDAALLRMPLVGFCEAADPQMAGTVEAIQRSLSRGELVYRRAEQTASGEGAFLACSFWLVDCLARQGRLTEAMAAFESLAARANDVGLFAEEISAEDGSFLGNFPLAFSHTALINAAVTLGKEGAM